MLLDITYVIVGLFVLIWSADKFIDGASGVASYFGMSPLVVGILIVGFGTSAPEMMVSAFAAIDNSPGIALGNAYGSNITNIGLVLAITCLFYPISVGSRIVRREIPILIASLFVCFIFFIDGELTQIESLLMLVMVFAIMMFNIFYGSDKGVIAGQINNELDNKVSKKEFAKQLLILLVSLFLLLVSSKYLVSGAVGIAQYFGVSDLIIGLTIIAIGTSLPELASSIAAARKGESDMVLGNIVGSCLFNSLAVVGIAGVIKPLNIMPVFLPRDFAIGFFLALLLWLFAFGIKKSVSIGKKKGGAMLFIYIIYTIYLFLTLKV